MEVIPVINCPDGECARRKIAILKTFLPEGSFVHLDVTDGVFSAHRTWHDPIGWKNLDAPYKLEAHLMTEGPEEMLDAWIAAGMKRCVIHAEAVRPALCHGLIERCEHAGIKVMISTNPDTPVNDLNPYFKLFSAFQVLAVQPGAEGQKFLTQVLDKIAFIRGNVGDAIIEVDGGMNPETAGLVKAAGADIIVSSSYIFNSEDPPKAYEALKNI
jgi:ribulose-phosphate 3-epimerase